jgi:hypothetical protein
MHADKLRAPTGSYRERVSTNASAGKAAPELPAGLRDPRPVILVGTVLWVLAAVASFTVAALEHWRPVTLAGIGVSLFGLTLFLWQRSAARRGVRGAQTGLD